MIPSVGRGQIRLDERSNFHNSAFVKTSETVDALFFEAELARENGDTRESVRVLERVLSSEPRALVRLGDRTFVPAKRRARIELEALGEEAWSRYENGAAERAQEDLEKALRLGSFEKLWSVVDAYPGLEVSRTALRELGDRSFEQGSFAAAAHAYVRLLEQYDEDRTRESAAIDKDRAEVQARLDLTRILRGEPAHSSLDASVVHEGVELDKETWRSYLGRESESRHNPGWPTLLGSRTRLRNASSHLDKLTDVFGAPARLGLEKTLGERQFLLNITREENTFATSPMIWGDIAIFPTADRLRFFDLAKGQEAFGPVRYDHDLFIDSVNVLIDERSVHAFLGGSILYLCMNAEERGARRKGNGYLYALDLERDALPVWRFDGEMLAQAFDPGSRAFDPGENQAPFSFSGPPLIVDGDVYLAASRLIEDRTEAVLAKVNAEKGRVERITSLCSGTAVMRFGARFARSEAKRVELSPVAERDGVLYLVSNIGVILAVSAPTGHTEWAFLYNRLFPLESQEYQPETVFGDSGWPITPVMVTADRVIAAPSDSRFLYCLAHQPSREGFLVVEEPVEKMTYERLVGAYDSMLIFEDSPGDSRRLVGTNLAGGVIFETPSLRSEEFFTGWPVYSDGFLLVPTNKQLYRLQLEGQSGKIDRFWGIPARLPLLGHRDECFGTLAVAPGNPKSRAIGSSPRETNMDSDSTRDRGAFVLSLSKDWYIIYRVDGS